MSAGSFAAVVARSLFAAGVALGAGYGRAAGGDGTTGGRADHSPASSGTILEGYRRINGVCGHCHGPDGVGSSFAPSLVDQSIAPEKFRSIVLEGTRTGASVMRGYAGDPNVAPYIDAMLAYLNARRQGQIGRGRPGEQ